VILLLATAGGFGGDYDARPPSYTLAPDPVLRLAVAGVLLLLLALWAWMKIRSVGPLSRG
jgi:hypothetical protein